MISVMYHPKHTATGYEVPYQMVVDAAIRYASQAAKHDDEEWIVYDDNEKRVYARPVSSLAPEKGKEIYRTGEQNGKAT